MMMLFSQMTALPLAIAAMVAFSVFVMISEGATFGLVPFMDKKRLGAVAGIVGAGGNMGAVIWSSTLFSTEALTYAQGFSILGALVVGIAFLSFLVRFSQETIDEEDAGPGRLAARRRCEHGRPACAGLCSGVHHVKLPFTDPSA